MGIIGTYEGFVTSPLYLFNNGNWGGGQNGYTSVYITTDDVPTINIKNGALYVTAYGWTTLTIRLNNVISLTNYNYLKVYSTSNHSWTGIGLGINSTPISSNISKCKLYLEPFLNSSNSSYGTTVLDISAISGNYWVYVQFETAANANKEIVCNQIFLSAT